MPTEAFSRLARAIEAAINRPAPTAKNTDTLADLTVNQIRAGVSKNDVGLNNLPNYAKATNAEAVAGTRNDRLVTNLGVTAHHTSALPPTAGGSLAVDATNQVGSLKATPLLIPTIIVDSDAELSVAQGSSESFSKVFDVWQRISHGGNGLYPSYPKELNDWTYDAATDRLSCTVNSISLVGFISPDAYDNFEFEVRVNTAGKAGDDELIGICFGFVEEGGREHILTAMRTPCGRLYHTDYQGDTIHYPKLFDIWYNLFAPDEMDLGSTNGGLKWADGIVDDTRNPFSEMQVAAGGLDWKNFPNGCLIKAVKQGSTITLTTTDLESNVYVPSATVVIDLNSHPALAKFKGSVRIGYVAYSQPNASWVTLKRPGARTNIVDIRNYMSYLWDGASWVAAGGDAYKQLLQPGRFYHNPNSNRTFYLERDREMLSL